MILQVKCKVLIAAVAFFCMFTGTFSSFGQQVTPTKEVTSVEEEENTESEVILDEGEADSQVLMDTVAVIDEEIIIPEFPKEVIEDRLSCLQTTIPLNFNNTTNGFIHYLTVRKRSYTTTMTRRQHLYFPIFEESLKKHGLPDELKYLSIVESGLNPKAVSVARAVGLWQFMSPTGRQYRLYQDQYIDERMDPYKSTEAACTYLKNLRDMFDGDWELALAAYNCGPGNVRRAIRRAGNKTNFWQIYNHLPRETRSYVPMFVAVNYVMNYLDEHNIVVDSLERYIPSDTILLSSQHVDLELFSKQLEVPLEDLQKLNPQIKRNAIPAHIKSFTFRIPSEKKDIFAANRVSILDSCATTAKNFVLVADNDNDSPGRERVKIVHKVRRGEVLGRIADRYNVPVAKIKSWNRLRGNSIKVGQHLAIYVNRQTATRVAEAKATKNQSKQAEIVENIETSKKGKVYFVQPGDTLWRISQIHGGIPVEKIKKQNNLKSNELKPGQKLIIG